MCTKLFNCNSCNQLRKMGFILHLQLQKISTIWTFHVTANRLLHRLKNIWKIHTFVGVCNVSSRSIIPRHILLNRFRKNIKVWVKSSLSSPSPNTAYWGWQRAMFTTRTCLKAIVGDYFIKIRIWQITSRMSSKFYRVYYRILITVL